MRILQVITLCDLGGAQSVVVNLANSLVKEHEVIVAAGAGDGKMWLSLHPSVICEHIPSLRRALSLLNEIKTIRAMRKLYKKYHPDIIHLHSSKAGLLGRIAFPSAKIVYTVHGFDSIRIAHRKYLFLEKMLQFRCRTIIGVSKYDEDNLCNEGINNNVCFVYNGISQPLRLPESPFNKMRSYSKIILCIARLSPPKNVDLFLKVSELLPQYAFVWIGNQHEFRGQYSENVFFMGSLPNAGAYNEYADLFILPSNYEGLPMTIIEAMAFGKPVVASKVGGISEIVLDDENGYTVENSAKAFREKICYILENKDVHTRFSKNALKSYQEKLTVDNMIDGYLRIYNGIVD